jgi:flagellar protein FlgJ
MRTDVDISLHAPVRSQNQNTRAREAELEAMRLREAAREFEALLVEQMVKEMRRAVPKSELLGREAGQELFEEMLDGEFVRVMTRSGGIGIADYLVRSLGGQKNGA